MGPSSLTAIDAMNDCLVASPSEPPGHTTDDRGGVRLAAGQSVWVAAAPIQPYFGRGPDERRVVQAVTTAQEFGAGLNRGASRAGVPRPPARDPLPLRREHFPPDRRQGAHSRADVGARSARLW